MGRKANSHQSAAVPELLNFHFASSPPSQHQHSAQHRQTGGRNKAPEQQRYYQLEKDRKSSRRNASSQMFPLHSSPDHTFSLTRKSKQGYSYKGYDTAVSWDAVKAVKYLAPTNDLRSLADNQETCPICLDTFTSARITKCGHCFCLPCLIRHNHTITENSAIGVKCPCCGLPMHLDDIRPVIIESVLTPRVQTSMKLVKLHRTRDCPTPYLPRRGEWKRSAPNAIPTMTDHDAKFSRFTYIDPVAYKGLLTTNLADLERYASCLQHGPDLEILFVQMALEQVKLDVYKASEAMEEEQALMNQFSQSQAGYYQHIPEHLFSHCHHSQSTDDGSPNAVASRVRDLSVGSEDEYHSIRTRSESVGSEGNVSGRGGRQTRGYSIDSHDSGSNLKHVARPEQILPTPPASLYLEEHSSHFYQAVDGQLVFLSKFNMKCLATEFTSNPPDQPIPMDASPNELRRWKPLPDEIEGRILEVETVHLTPEMRKRTPVFTHLPLYTDILFVELDLNRLLSRETKQSFRKEFENRKQRRKNKAAEEKSIEQVQKRKEKERIDELKSRLQYIDPSDEFFSFQREPVALTGDDFGPSIGAVSPDSNPVADHGLNFRAIVNAPSSVAMTHDAFPSLGEGNFPNLTQDLTRPGKQRTRRKPFFSQRGE